MDLREYHKFHQLDMWDLRALSKSKNDYALILDGLTFSKKDIKKSLSVLKEMGHSLDKGNIHCNVTDSAKPRPAQERSDLLQVQTPSHNANRSRATTKGF
jgi:hypothetical protein